MNLNAVAKINAVSYGNFLTGASGSGKSSLVLSLGDKQVNKLIERLHLIQ